MTNRFQVLLSISTCAATARQAQFAEEAVVRARVKGVVDRLTLR
jgi:hypothetical protein